MRQAFPSASRILVPDSPHFKRDWMFFCPELVLGCLRWPLAHCVFYGDVGVSPRRAAYRENLVPCEKSFAGPCEWCSLRLVFYAFTGSAAVLGTKIWGLK